MITQIAVIGAGLMGHGLAQIFATKGCQVVLMDLKQDLLDKAIENIRSNLLLMSQNGIGTEQDIEPALQSITTTIDLKNAGEGAQFVVEAVAEKLEIKQRIFQELDAVCPSDTILATNTSVISITEIAEKASNRQRIVGTHFWNPPFLIPLVEVIKGRDTDPKVVDDTISFMKKMGKHPVRVEKDVPGFVGNRLQHALWREALSIVEQGIASPETVDEVIKNGFGIRLPVLGPLENMDLAGLDLTLAIHDYIFKHLDISQEASPLLRQKVKDGELGFKSSRGFSEWTEETMALSRKNLLEYLLKYVKENK